MIIYVIYDCVFRTPPGPASSSGDETNVIEGGVFVSTFMLGKVMDLHLLYCIFISSAGNEKLVTSLLLHYS